MRSHKQYPWTSFVTWTCASALVVASQMPAAAQPSPSAPPEAYAPSPSPSPSEPPAAAGAAAPLPSPSAPPAAAGAAAPAPRDTGRRHWTRDDVARIRAELAAQRAADRARRSRPLPRVYGDAGAPWLLGIELTTSFLNDEGFEIFNADRRQTRFGVLGQRDVLTLAPKLIAALELGASFESYEADRLLALEMKSQTLHAGVVLRWDALSVLSPIVHAWGGASLFQLDTRSGGPGSADLDVDDAASGFGALGGGLLLHTPARLFESRRGDFSSFGLGLWVEGGYALRSPIDLDLRTQTSARSIRVVDASLGRLSLSGPYLRFALVVRF
ncbi:MAG: hypothetical protein ABW321_18305 [Polyangiales bacterium]